MQLVIASAERFINDSWSNDGHEVSPPTNGMNRWSASTIGEAPPDVRIKKHSHLRLSRWLLLNYT